MDASAIPAKFPIPFANGAGAGYIRSIPTPSQTPTSTDAPASLTDGFPPTCFTPIGSGGIPPNGQDFNGLFNQITLWNQWQAAGAPVFYDPTFSAAIGGYPNGARLSSSATAGLVWISTADNNTTNPDSGGAANWIASGASTYGSNSNGFWEKRPSGVLEQWGVITGSFVQGLYGPYTFPVEFTTLQNLMLTTIQPEGTGSPGNAGDDFFTIPSINPPTASDFHVWCDSIYLGTDKANGFHWRALGRWY